MSNTINRLPAETLKELGITAAESERAQLLACIPAVEFLCRMKIICDAGRMPSAEAILAREWGSVAHRDLIRRGAAALVRQVIAAGSDDQEIRAALRFLSDWCGSQIHGTQVPAGQNIRKALDVTWYFVGIHQFDEGRIDLLTAVRDLCTAHIVGDVRDSS